MPEDRDRPTDAAADAAAGFTHAPVLPAGSVAAAFGRTEAQLADLVGVLTADAAPGCRWAAEPVAVPGPGGRAERRYTVAQVRAFCHLAVTACVAGVLPADDPAVTLAAEHAAADRARRAAGGAGAGPGPW